MKNRHGVAANIIESRIVQCQGCETFYFQRVGMFRNITEEVSSETDAGDFPDQRELFYPTIQVRERPNWLNTLGELDEVLAEWFNDIYFCFDNDKNGLAAIAVRTVVDRALLQRGCPSSYPFSKKIDWAIENSLILLTEKQIFKNLFEAGSAATHRGWRPNYDETNVLIVHLESFIHRTFVATDEAKKLKLVIPQRDND